MVSSIPKSSVDFIFFKHHTFSLFLVFKIITKKTANEKVSYNTLG